MNNTHTVVDTVNDNGTVTRVITEVRTITLSAEQYQTEQDNIQKQIDDLSTQLTKNQAVLQESQNVLIAKPAQIIK